MASGRRAARAPDVCRGAGSCDLLHLPPHRASGFVAHPLPVAACACVGAESSVRGRAVSRRITSASVLRRRGVGAPTAGTMPMRRRWQCCEGGGLPVPSGAGKAACAPGNEISEGAAADGRRNNELEVCKCVRAASPRACWPAASITLTTVSRTTHHAAAHDCLAHRRHLRRPPRDMPRHTPRGARGNIPGTRHAAGVAAGGGGGCDSDGDGISDNTREHQPLPWCGACLCTCASS